MRKATLVYLYGQGEPGLSLANGFLKAFADADPAIKAAWSIDILHGCIETDLERVADELAAAAPDVVGFSTYSWNIKATHQEVRRLPRLNGKPFVVLGGVEVTPRPIEVMKENRRVDAVVVGEGEETFRELLRRLDEDPDAAANDNLGDVNGVAWRRGKSTRINDPRRPIPDLSVIPSPYLEGSYGDYLKTIETVPVETARGCPYSCTFCFEPRGFKTMRAFEMDRVQAELLHLIKLGVPEIEFYDTNVNYDRKRSVEIFRFLAKKGRHTRYRFELRAELIDQAQADALAPLAYFAEIGLQSTNMKALNAVKRTLHPQKFESGVKSLLAASPYRPCSYSPLSGVLIDVMVGLPHDTAEDILASFDYTFSLVPSRVAVAITKVLPGTELYDDVLKKKYRFKFDSDADHIIRSNATLSRSEVQDFIHFKYAADLAYNKLHAVRTIGWMATTMDIRPSAIFMEIGQTLKREERYWDAYTIKDLGQLLAAICRKHGNEDAAKKVESKLMAEAMLNMLQNLKEKRRSFWARALFRVGHRLLTMFTGLAPLPEGVPAGASITAPANQEAAA